MNEQEYEYDGRNPDFTQVPMLDKVKEVAGELLDVNSAIQNMEMNLRGKILDVTTGLWIQVGKQRMNEDGIKQVMGTIIMYVNKNTVLSTLDETEIAYMSKEVANNLNALITQNQDIFEINESDRQSLLNDIVNVVFITLNRAKDGKTREMFEKTVSVVEQSIKHDNSSRSILPWRR